MSEKIEYRRIDLPNGEYLQVKYDAEGIVYDRFDKDDKLLEVYGYDLYEETTIPEYKSGITTEDVDDLGKTAYETLLKTLYVLETTEARFLSNAIVHAKQEIYKACPELLPKDPRDAQV